MFDNRSCVRVFRCIGHGVALGQPPAVCRRESLLASLVGAVDFWWDVTKIPPGPRQDARKASYGPRLRELVTSIDPRPRAAQIPPKAVCLINGQRDGYIDIESVRRFVAELTPLYQENQDRLRFIPFPDAGHEVTGAMWNEAQQWIARHLERKPQDDKSDVGREK